MLSLKVTMLVLVFILLSIQDTTIAHTTPTHDQDVKQKFEVDEAGNGIPKLGDQKESYYGYYGHYDPVTIQVTGRGRKEMEEGNKKDSKNSVKWEGKMRILQSKLLYGKKVNRASLMAFTAADYHGPTTHPPKNN